MDMDPAGSADPHASHLATKLVDSCNVGIAKLPTELLYHIIRLAASSDHKTAHTCAYVSRLVCTWTAPDRWRTIICTSLNQVRALWHALEFQSPQQIHGFTSLPGPQPGIFVENLFIDAAGSESTLELLAQEQRDLEPCLERSCPRLNTNDVLMCGEKHVPHKIRDFLRHFQYVNYLALGALEVGVFRLDCISPAKVLYASQSEFDFEWFLTQTATPLSDDPDDPPSVDDALWRADGTGVWKPSLQTFRRRLNSLHIVAVDPQSELSGITMPVVQIEALRSGSFGQLSFVQRTANHLQGGPPPRLSPDDRDKALASKWYIWPAEDRDGRRRYIRGSDPLPSWSADSQQSGDKTLPNANEYDSLHPFDNNYSRISPAFWDEFQQGVTKIRYDTRRFAFRPCEITASRLRPFFEELTSTDANVAATDGSADTSATTSFTHSGPRHAAPHRGAGHFSKPDRGAQHGKGAPTAYQAALDSFGCGKFQTLHLCWDPLPKADSASDDAQVARQPNAGKAPSSSSPPNVRADSDWPVERQDIWTNTSSQNNEAQAPPPHTVQPRANASSTTSKAKTHDRPEPASVSRNSWIISSSIEPSSSKSFRADLIDSIRTTIGWTRQDQLLLSDTPWLGDATNLARRMGHPQRLACLESIVSEMAYQQTHLAAAGSVAVGDEKLAIRLVPPAERLKLGGMYVPYTKEQRVQWFLDNLETDDA